ncbi:MULTISPECIES: ABC transporter permease [Halomicrobium]|uniref:Binding-protein-dependent transport systems inner membrane component n=2 Tax=Halomicrobium mukohataei TaxID=57705 RepID=C7P3N8_HALMD|nr:MULTISPECIES: ABC transporter permease [Halomicrobium]ACV47710.1 binding-protein-dependent transport systems inner membrane component [Halomicrobium mukohataei DSM 12286]QCD66163.1 ABC transporter permease [Halomicrobium mukohataei]QFR20968.1 ABC transporter permease subunit [Halomicrobium sp. ZPS1]
MATIDESDSPTARDAVEEPGEEPAEIEARVGWRYTFSQIRSDPTAMTGLAIIAAVTAMATFATIDSVLFEFLAGYRLFAQFGVEKYWIAKTVWVSPVSESAATPRLLPPVGFENQFGAGSWAHPLGTDDRGRDILLRLVYGSRIAVTVGLSATVVGFASGTVVGAVSGYYGDWVDDVLMRAAETLFAIPFLVLVLAFIAVFGRSLTFIVFGVGIASIPTFARLIRSRVVSIREEDYIEAAQAAGVRDRDIIFRHVIPNSFTPVLVQATLQVGTAILIVAGLSFLGFGVQPPTPSWGQMLAVSRNYMIPNPWFSVWPGLAILVTVVGFNIFGDGLRDALDPRFNN